MSYWFPIKAAYSKVNPTAVCQVTSCVEGSNEMVVFRSEHVPIGDDPRQKRPGQHPKKEYCDGERGFPCIVTHQIPLWVDIMLE